MSDNIPIKTGDIFIYNDNSGIVIRMVSGKNGWLQINDRGRIDVCDDYLMNSAGGVSDATHCGNIATIGLAILKKVTNIKEDY